MKYKLHCDLSFTCSEKVRARSVSTDPLGGSTISWDLKIRLEPCKQITVCVYFRVHTF